MKLADYLALKNQSDASFADEVGVTSKAVQHWLSGARTPRPEQMQKIMDATMGAVTPNDFLPFRSKETAEAAQEREALSLASIEVRT